MELSTTHEIAGKIIRKNYGVVTGFGTSVTVK